MTVGLIGYGRFGKLAARHISRQATILVYDKNRRVRSSSKRIRSGSLHQAASQQVVILAVPISSLKKTLTAIATLLVPTALVIDVCAVKTLPIKWMNEILPKHTQILGTHPLFGPDSAHKSLAEHQVFLCPVRVSAKRLRHIIRLLKQARVTAHVIEPRKHDKLMAETLFVTQCVGRLAGAMRLPRHANSTKSYEDLMKLAQIAGNDSRELFRDMFVFNPYAKNIVEKLVQAQRRIVKELLS